MRSPHEMAAPPNPNPASQFFCQPRSDRNQNAHASLQSTGAAAAWGCVCTAPSQVDPAHPSLQMLRGLLRQGAGAAAAAVVASTTTSASALVASSRAAALRVAAAASRDYRCDGAQQQQVRWCLAFGWRGDWMPSAAGIGY